MKTVNKRLLALVIAGTAAFGSVAAWSGPLEWWKGNLHTHSLWSDGDDYPEMIVDWYKSRGYHFLALSDHNVLSEGRRWVNVAKNRGGRRAFERYLKRFGEQWVETRGEGEAREVRLKPYNEFRHLFEESSKFALFQGEEITDAHEGLPVHLNVTNVRDFIPPQGGGSVLDVMQNNVNAVLEQRAATGRMMFPHLNHPNFGWAVTAEELMEVAGERFYEVYNGHPAVRNEGDATHAGVERMWDIILAWRIAVLDHMPLYGLAVDDAHNYHDEGPAESNPGRGWVMVRSAFLTPEHIISAMEAGDFYASTGVELFDVRRDDGKLSIMIRPEAGVAYTTRFIGTRRGFDRASEPVRDADGRPLGVTRRYSDDVGRMFAEVPGLTPSYTLRGDELYVRAIVHSTRLKENPYMPGEVEKAWIQPWVGGGAGAGDGTAADSER